MIDSHAHLNAPRLYPIIRDVLKRASDVGVTEIIVPGYDLEFSVLAAEIAKAYEPCFGVVGVHPHDSNTYNDRVETKLIELASEKKIVGIGEIGLDYHYDNIGLTEQRNVFIALS